MSLEKRIRSFLQGPRKGETFELKAGLVSQYKHERKDAIQRVIQAMTVGKDVSALFPDVLKNIATYDIEQKKLVYLYLMNYAKTHPELCILAVNTFVQDTEDPNPLIRALAVRTMGCIRVAKIVDYMQIPLLRTLADDNPYVRKTAALCVAKLYDLSPEMCQEYGFIELLRKLIADPNPMVVANALLLMYEIRDRSVTASGTEPVAFAITPALVKLLLLCLNECTEWGRITILTTLTDYKTNVQDELVHIVERVVPQLQHVNPLVVLLLIKCIVHHLGGVNDSALKLSVLKKLLAPLVLLVSNLIPEAQYVGLKNIRIILEKYPLVLSKELRVFFLKYLDPLYLKLEKLDIMIRLANEQNSVLLLGELKEYAMEFEPLLVRKAIRSIGAVAIKVQPACIRLVNLLCNLIDLRGGELIINELFVVLTNILRRYPGQNDLITLIVPVLSNHHDDIEANSEALSGYMWCLGEFPKYFKNAQTTANLTRYIEDFLVYEPALQLNLLHAVVKINLSIDNSGTLLKLLQKILELATQGCENADVRDKAYIYWRLLSLDDVATQRKIILHKLPPINSTVPKFSPAVLEALMEELLTVLLVYQKPAATFIDKDAYVKLERGPRTPAAIDDLANLAKSEIINNAKNENLLDFEDDDGLTSIIGNGGTTGGASGSVLDDLNDLFLAVPRVPQPHQAALQALSGSAHDVLGLFGDVQPRDKPKDPAPGASGDLLDLF
jgi:AP-1 complex subunit beta-1